MARWALQPLRLLPRALSPVSKGWEYAEAARFRSDKALYAPFGLGLIIRYAGWLRPDAG